MEKYKGELTVAPHVCITAQPDEESILPTPYVVIFSTPINIGIFITMRNGTVITECFKCKEHPD